MINVFGGRGFIGSVFVKRMAELEHERVIKHCEETGERYMQAMERSCLLNDREDYVPHTNNILYFISTVDNYNVLTNPFIDIETNLITMMKVLSNITDKENTVFNFISSWFVYGEATEPAKEDSVCNPKGFYSITKRTAEELLISYCQTFGIKYRIMRLANVIGPDDRKTSTRKNAIVWMMKELQCDRSVYMYDGGMLTRDMIDVEDCVDAIKLVMDKGELNSIYNIGNGTPYTLNDILTVAKRITNSKGELKSSEAPPLHNLIQIKCAKMDTTRLRALGYTPKHTLEDTINRILYGNQNTNT